MTKQIAEYVNWQSALRKRQKEDPDFLAALLVLLQEQAGMEYGHAVRAISGKRVFSSNELAVLERCLGLPRKWEDWE